MRNRIILIIALLVFSRALPAADTPSIEGHWEGNITVKEGLELGILIDFKPSEDGAWTGGIDIPVQGAKDLPLTNIQVGDSIRFEIVGAPGKPTFDGKLSEDGNSLSGTFTQSGQTLSFELKRTVPREPEKKTRTQEEIINDIRDRVKTTMAQWHVPGLALAIIQKGEVVLAEGFGTRDIKSNKPVTVETLFAIGSSTKAFTATLMGIAVDDGKIKWDEQVREHIPSFRLQDTFATERMTPKDLLTHRSGLPRHDVMWYGSTLTRKEMFDRLRYLEPSEDFRAVFQYQNLMFLTAGYLEEQLYSQPWESLVKEKIFEPLGMNHSNLSVTDSQKTEDFALPYEYKQVDESSDKKEIRELPFRNIDAVGPAGSINSNVRDMAQWVRMNLNGGTLNDRTIVSKSALDEIQSPQIVVRGGLLSQLLSFPETPYLMYGMGWMIQPYRGHRLLHHGGNIDGFSAMVSFMPDDKLGLVILTNLDGNLLVNTLLFEIYDRLLQLDPVDWNARYRLLYTQVEAVAKESGKKEDEVRRKKGTRTSHPLPDFAGEYDHPAYGKLTVRAVENALQAELHGIESGLEHFHYDIFRGLKEPMKGLKFTFLTNLRGDIDRVTIPLEEGVDDIVFSRVAPPSMSDPVFLAQFAGEYELMGLTIKVEVRGDHLFLSVPGQPSHTLDPYSGTEFDLRDQKGYSVKFTVANKQATEVVFLQPNGVFTAKRKT